MQLAELSEHVKMCEQKFKVKNYKRDSIFPCTVKKYGDLPVLLSAPHSVK